MECDSGARRPRLFRAETVGESLHVYLPATLVSKFVGLGRGLVLPWLMPQGAYGLASIAVAIVNLLNPLCSGGLNDAVQRYVPQYETRGLLRRFLALAVPLVVLVGAAMVVGLFIFADPLGRLLFETLPAEQKPAPGAARGLARLVVGGAFGVVVFSLAVAILRGLRMYRAIGLMELASNSAFAALAVLVCLLGWRTAGAVVTSYAVSLLALSAIAAVLLPRVIRQIDRDGHGRAQPAGGARESFGRRGVVDQLFRFSRWAALAAATWQVLLGYPQWYLHKVAGAEVVAVFAAVQLLAQGMVIVANSVVTVVGTTVTKTWEARGSELADRHLMVAYKTTALLLLAVGVVAAVAAPWVMRILPGGYGAGASILPLLLLFYLLAGHLLFLGVHFHLIERTRHLFVPWILGVAGHVAFSAWWVRMGPTSAAAAAWAGIAGMSVALAAALVLMWLERRPFDGGAWILVLAGYALAGPRWWTGPAMLAAVVFISLATSWVFTTEQKVLIRERLRGGIEQAVALWRGRSL